MASLPRLHGPGRKTSPFTDMFHVVNDGNVRASVQNKVAMHAVYEEILGDSLLRCGEALRNDCSTIDSSRSRGMPKGPCVREEVGVDVVQMSELEHILDGGFVVGGWRGFDERGFDS